MQSTNVSTQEFWEYMGKAGFRRIDLHTGTIAGQTITTSIPPENTDIPMKAIESCIELLRIRDTWLTKLINIFKG